MAIPTLELFTAQFAETISRIEAQFANAEELIPAGVTFVEWIEQLADAGMRVDGKPFRFDNRAALRFVYSQVPNTREEATRWKFAVMKGAQTGLTVWEMLVSIWCAVKFYPFAVGSYVPDRTLAQYKSTYRFMPILRGVPVAYDLLRSTATSSASKEGNVMTRAIGASKILFLYTTGSVSTESFPLDGLNFDEVQGMSIADIEKIRERMSASDVKMELYVSTAMMPDEDIDYLYKRGTRMRFHTACGCPDGVVLDDYDAEIFPNCIAYNEGQYTGAPPDEYVYRCPKCDVYIPDTQEPAAVGNNGWVEDNPGAPYQSLHYPQTLSATVTAREMYESFATAQSLENFFRRKLGRPFMDPSRIPVTMAMLEACAAEGIRIGLQWKKLAKGCYMGIDQMGAFNVVIIKERLADGRQAVVHAEMIYDADPFARCDDLMVQFGVVVAVVENLPNYNDAKRFAQRHKGKVFIADYGSVNDEMLRWGDTNLTRIERKTNAAERDHYTVSIDQYKCMQVSMQRLVKTQCLFPDPSKLIQQVIENKISKASAIVREHMFVHFTKTALVTELIKEDERKFRRRVVKVGIDPHFSYANMLCDVAWARAFGTASFMLPDAGSESGVPELLKQSAPQPLPVNIPELPKGVICGRCIAFRAETNHCVERKAVVRAQDVGCPWFAAKRV
ncbi:phage terminase large subunit family protein [Nevskia sp.]|uniref:phage terminase large subunit family protein n=1 Tax=Nevskia sp. TaxID=1929292 RepID=UPI0025D4BF95|nr:phage terminase large subunit family protein [Nevskia sp.]